MARQVPNKSTSNVLSPTKRKILLATSEIEGKKREGRTDRLKERKQRIKQRDKRDNAKTWGPPIAIFTRNYFENGAFYC